MSIKPNKFFNLHGHSRYSIFDAIGSPKEYFNFINKNSESNGTVISDHGNLSCYSSAYKYQQELIKKGINFKYIPAIEAYVHPDLKQWEHEYKLNKQELEKKKQEKKELSKKTKKEETETVTTEDDDETSTSLVIENEDESKRTGWKNPLRRRSHLVIIAKNSQGLQELFELVSFSFTKGFYYFPRIDYKKLKEVASKGNLLCSSACLAGPFAYEMFNSCIDIPWDEITPDVVEERKHIILPKIENVVDSLVDCFGKENVNLELQFNRLQPQNSINKLLIETSIKTGVPLVVTSDFHYSDPELWKAREMYKRLAYLGSSEKDPLPSDVSELKAELYPKNEDQIWESYLESKKNCDFYDDQIIIDAIERTYDIAYNQIGKIEPDRSKKLPSFVVPENTTDIEELIRYAREGLKKRGLDTNQVYVDRLEFELDIISQKKFAKYFLTVKKILDIAREHMLLGFGRGSAASSMACYCLEITDVDPIKYGLLFNRFIDLARTEDADIDSDVANRDALLDFLRKEFGEEQVIAISNYNTLGVKSLMKDVSKFYDIDYQKINMITKFLDKEIIMGAKADGIDKADAHITFENAVKYSLQFNEFLKEYPEVGELISKLEGEIRSISRHAGGVIVCDDILNRMPVIKSKKILQTPWVEGLSSHELEPLGWVKIDILGLETLQIFEECISLILQKKQGIKNPKFSDIRDWYEKNLSPSVLDLEDQHVYENVWHNNHYAGIFQASQKDTQKYFTKAKPTSIEEIGVLTSLYRPGPCGVGAHERYVKNKENYTPHNNKIIEEILGPTNGILSFQEQAMILASRLGNISDLEVNIFRKLISKKPKKEDVLYQKFLELKEKFINGAISNGLPKEEAETLFESIEEFAKYSFNKCIYAFDFVETKERGNVFIKDVLVGEHVNSTNGFVKVLDVIEQGKKRIWCLSAGGFSTKTTIDHKFETNRGMKTLSEIKEDKEIKLKVNKDKMYIKCDDDGCINWDWCVELYDSDTYDLEVDHPDHTFYVNNISVSNSHAISYSINSYICAWLLTYYPSEWLCAYIQTRQNNPDKKTEAVSEIKSLGYELSKLDINYAIDKWSINGDKSLMPSITSCKGVGKAAFEELNRLRPYKSIYDLLWEKDGSFKHTKFNKTCMDVLLKIEAFQSLDMIGESKLFQSYAHAHRTIIDNWNLLRKKLKKDTFDTQCEKLNELAIQTNSDDWSLSEKLSFYKEITGEIDIRYIMSDQMQKKLYRKGYKSIEEYPEDEDECLIWFIVDSFEKKKTKNGKFFLNLRCFGLLGKEEIIKVWDWNSSYDIKLLRAYIGMVKRNNYGYSLNIKDLMLLPNE